MQLSQLYRWSGNINRKDYILWGLILFGLKYNLDRLTAWAFEKSWYFSDYFIQADRLGLQELESSDLIFYAAILAQSIPFIWMGTVLCVKRLRDANLSAGLVLFFFIPFINLLLFILLSAIPSGNKVKATKRSFLPRLIPKNKLGSAVFSLGATLVFSSLLMGIFIQFLEAYGWGLFIGIPFFLGFGSVIIYGYHNQLAYRQALGVMVLAVLFFNLLIFILAFEGIICLAMAFPLMFFIAWIGATIGYAVHKGNQMASLNTLAAPLLFIPLIGAIEQNDMQKAPIMEVSTEIIVEASRQEVWDELVAFGQIDEPEEWLFKTGIAYPTHATIVGTGVGAVRKCNFTTGAFIEPITIWDEPDLLAFSVLEQPPPMMEWSMYKDLEIEHLTGYFKSNRGQFQLVSLENGNTRLIGTTWYSHDIWPISYWRLWSDPILHRIHHRVLNHIKSKAEKHS